MVTDSSSRLTEISAELSTILEARIQELTRAMKGAEQTTRQIVATEMEIARHRQVQASMGPELQQLNHEVESLKLKVEELRGEHGRLSNSRDEARAEVSRSGQELKEVEAETEQLRIQARKIEEESEILRRENGDLRNKLRTLEENVVRMRKLKEELMASISGLSQQMSALSLGSKD